ncbi:MAG: cytochrome c oxidase assembly protein [Casimicrobiaceae bacterium]
MEKCCESHHSVSARLHVKFGMPSHCAGRSRESRAVAAIIVAFAASRPLVAGAQELGKFVAHAAQSRWSFEPWELVCLGLSAGLYTFGLARLWTRVGRGRGVSVAEVSAFVAGWLAIVAALLSPLDAMGQALFCVHMVEHELLMIVAAPLLVLGRPLAVWAWALPAGWRGPIGAFFHRPGWRVPWLLLTGPFWAWVLHALALWLWHIPALFEAALDNDAVHALQHISFLGTALIFWWSVLGGVTRHDRGIASLSLFTTMVHTGALGALLTLSTVVWYPSYAASASAWGLTPLEDQELGGIIMWVPAGLVYIIVGIVLASRWLAEPRRSDPRRAKRA